MIVLQHDLAEVEHHAQRLLHVVRGDVGKALELGVRFHQPQQEPLAAFLGELRLGDVADDAGKVAHAVDGEGRDRQVDGKDFAGLAPGLDLTAGGADDLGQAGGQVVGEIAVVPRLVRLGHQHLDVLAHDLVGRIAEDAHARLVEAFDAALLVDGDDAVEHIVDDGAQRHAAGLFRQLVEPFQFGIGLLQLGIGLVHLRRARNGQGLGNQRDQGEEGADRGYGGQRLDRALDIVVGMPQHPDAQDVGRAAQQDKGAEQPEHRRKRHVRPLADEIDQHTGDAEIGERDGRVGQNVQPQHVRSPQKAKAVGHELPVRHFVHPRLLPAGLGAPAPLVERCM